jgi:hypothetical protein
VTSLVEAVPPPSYGSIRRFHLVDAGGGAVFQRRTLLRRLQEVDLSPAEAWALLARVHTHTSSADERERLAHLIGVTTAVTAPLQAAPARQATRPRQLAKAARRRQRP